VRRRALFILLFPSVGACNSILGNDDNRLKRRPDGGDASADSGAQSSGITDASNDGFAGAGGSGQAGEAGAADERSPGAGGVASGGDQARTEAGAQANDGGFDADDVTTGAIEAGITVSCSDCPAGTVCSRRAPVHCYDPAWPDWPMPNSHVALLLDGGVPHPKSYDTTAIAGVVVDNVTGLQWQRAVDAPPDGGPGGSDGGSGLYLWEAAKRYCSNLPLAGGGWRLPSRIELVSLIDTTRMGPSIDVIAFPGTPPESFWTSSPSGLAYYAWSVSFTYGNVGNYSSGDAKAFRVRCVR